MAWGKGRDREGRRASHWLAPTDQPLFAMAGVWKDSEVPSFALLTCEANAAWRALGQDRMPVILPGTRAAQDLWLRAEWKRASALLAPYPSSLIAEINGSAAPPPR
jgi:putative SOS response-associated peptidase YedK